MKSQNFVVLIPAKDRDSWRLSEGNTKSLIGWWIVEGGPKPIIPGTQERLFPRTRTTVLVADHEEARKKSGVELLRVVECLDDPTVLVHFGGKNSSAFTRRDRQDYWAELCDSEVGAFEALKRVLPFPFSMGAGSAAMRWDLALTECAQQFRRQYEKWNSQTHDSFVAKLGSAAEDARDFYDGLAELRRWLNVCFPLYLDLRGMASADREKRAEYWAEARKALIKSLNPGAPDGPRELLSECLDFIESSLRRDQASASKAQAILARCRQAPDLLVRLPSSETAELALQESTDPLLALSELYRMAEQHCHT